MDIADFAPAEDTVPEQKSGAERRLILRFFTAWENLADSNSMPGLQDFTPSILAPFKARSILIDMQDGVPSATLRYVGERIAALIEPGWDYRGAPLHSVPGRCLLSRLTAHATEVVSNRAPIGFEAEFTDNQGRTLPYRGLLAPLSRDGLTIDFLIGVLSWQDPRPEPKTQPETQQETQQDANPDVTLGTATFNLAPELAALRSAAQTAGRSRAALYELLARVHAFTHSCKSAPAELMTLLKDSSIRVQSRAPETAILKLVFGKDHDKTRLTEYAAALSLAAREGLDSEAFLARLKSFSGGLKAMVREERQARHPYDSGSEDPTATVRAVITDWRSEPADMGETLHLIARTTGDGRIEILDIVKDKIVAKDKIVKERRS